MAVNFWKSDHPLPGSVSNGKLRSVKYLSVNYFKPDDTLAIFYISPTIAQEMADKVGCFFCSALCSTAITSNQVQHILCILTRDAGVLFSQACDLRKGWSAAGRDVLLALGPLPLLPAVHRVRVSRRLHHASPGPRHRHCHHLRDFVRVGDGRVPAPLQYRTWATLFLSHFQKSIFSSHLVNPQATLYPSG